MSLSLVEIYNMALGLAGGRVRLSAPDEQRREAELCQQFFPAIRSQLFTSAFWNCGKQIARLSVLAENDFADDWQSTDPQLPWHYAYGVPSGCARPRYLTDYSKFELGRYGSVNAILTDHEDPILIYTKIETNTALWDEMLTQAAYSALAAMLVRPLSGSAKKAQELTQEANRLIMQARENEANVDHIVYETMPDWLTARGISGPSAINRYVYPVGPLFVGNTA